MDGQMQNERENEVATANRDPFLYGLCSTMNGCTIGPNIYGGRAYSHHCCSTF